MQIEKLSILSIIINITNTRKQKAGENNNTNEQIKIQENFPDKIIIIQKNIEKKQ